MIAPQAYLSILDLAQKIKQPLLVFDLNAIRANMVFLRRLGRKYNCRFLMATKSFPHPVILNEACRTMHGFDVSNLKEYKSLPRHLEAKLIWVSSPTLNSNYKFDLFYKKKNAAVFSVSSPDQFSHLQRHAEGCDFAIRVNCTSVIKHKNRKQAESRFGFQKSDLNDLTAIVRNKRNRFVGFHFHQGFNQNKIDDYVKMAQWAAGQAKRYRVRLSMLNLGGGLASLSEEQIEAMIRRVRGVIPQKTLLVFEPGRFLTQNAGYAVGHVLSVTKTSPRRFICTLDISKESHLMWSSPLLLVGVHQKPNKHPVRVEFVGPTCSEYDRLGEFATYEDQLVKGAAVVFSNLCGYSATLNQTFNGLKKAKIHFLRGS